MRRVKPEFHCLALASIHCPTASKDERCLSLKLNDACIRKDLDFGMHFMYPFISFIICYAFAELP